MQNIPLSPEPSAPSETPNVNANKPLYILDAFALMAYLQNESGQAQVEKLLAQALNDECDVWMSLINWGEVVYSVAREQGDELANQVIADIDRAPISLIEITRARVAVAARIKSQHRVSYADAFAIALAQEFSATVVTNDPEFRSVQESISILWLAG